MKKVPASDSTHAYDIAINELIKYKKNTVNK